MDLLEVQSLLLRYLDALSLQFQRIPGSYVLIRYVKVSYQNDPVRSTLEFFLFLFAVHYLLAPKYSTKHGFVKLTDQEIDELVEDWTPEPLVPPAPGRDMTEVEKRVILAGPTAAKSKLTNGVTVTNLASYDYYNLIANKYLKNRAIETLRTHGVGPCGPPGFYGTQDVHIKTETDIASLLGVPAAILYSQAFSTPSSVIPAFSKRGDIIVADKGCNYALRKGMQLSRSTIRWYEHNDMEDLEQVLAKVCKEQRNKPLSRRFIITEGLFEERGDMATLSTIVQLKRTYKFRLILDESWSFGVLGKTGRGITEQQNVDANQVDILVGSLAGPLIAGGGFCAGSEDIIHHQRISSLAYCFSCALPGLLATTASEVMNLLHTNPNMMAKLRTNIAIMRSQLDPRSDFVYCASAPENPMMFFPLKPVIVKNRKLTHEDQDDIMQEIIDDALEQNVLVTRLKPIRDLAPLQGAMPPTPALKICMSLGLSKKEIERTGVLIRNSIVKVMRSRKRE